MRSRRLAGSWWLGLLSSLAWLILSGIVVRLTTATAATVLLAGVFLLSASDQFLDRARCSLPPERKLAGHAVAAALALLLTLVLVGLRDRLSPAADVLAFLLAVIAVALAGGLIPAVIEAVAGALLLHALVAPQPGSSAIAGVSDAAVLGVLVALAVVVGVLTEEAARRGRRAALAAEAARLAAETAVNCLRSPSVRLTAAQHEELRATVEESLGRFIRLAADATGIVTENMTGTGTERRSSGSRSQARRG